MRRGESSPSLIAAFAAIDESVGKRREAENKPVWRRLPNGTARQQGDAPTTTSLAGKSPEARVVDHLYGKGGVDGSSPQRA
jgi:hypothetical protein